MKAIARGLMLFAFTLFAASEVLAQANRPMIEVTPGKVQVFKAAVQEFAEPRVRSTARVGSGGAAVLVRTGR